MTRTLRTTPNVKIARLTAALRDIAAQLDLAAATGEPIARALAARNKGAAEVIQLQFSIMRAMAALARAEIKGSPGR